MIPFLVFVAALVVVALLLHREDQGLPGNLPSVPTPPGAKSDHERTPLPDPFAYDPARKGEFERRAAAGTSHVLYARSPGGAGITAQRVARWRPQVEAAAKQAGVDPDRLEALVFLESAGREDAMAGDTEGAVGLTQILAETGQNLLGMHVDVAKSRRYTRRIRRELVRGHLLKVQRLRAARAKVDQRFDPQLSLLATARYLTMAKARFKREDLAFVSYHMGMGNLQNVLRAYGRATSTTRSSTSTPRRSATPPPTRSSPRSATTPPTTGGSSARPRRSCGSAATTPASSRGSSPPRWPRTPPRRCCTRRARRPRFATPKKLEQAWADEQIVAFPQNERVTGLRADAHMGELGAPPTLYQGLRPEALATALYIGAEVRAISKQSPLIVTSTVRDDVYQRRLVARNREATRNYSLHTTGWAFDIARKYRSKAHALAFQFVLDRLQVLDAIAWVREPGAIHVTAAPEGKALLPLLKRVQPGG